MGDWLDHVKWNSVRKFRTKPFSRSPWPLPLPRAGGWLAWRGLHGHGRRNQNWKVRARLQGYSYSRARPAGRGPGEPVKAVTLRADGHHDRQDTRLGPAGSRPRRVTVKGMSNWQAPGRLQCVAAALFVWPDWWIARAKDMQMQEQAVNFHNKSVSIS